MKDTAYYSVTIKRYMKPDFKILSQITIFNKYARYIPNLKRRETWDEICDRYQNMMQLKYPQLKDDITTNMQFVRDFKVLPSMRALQFAGNAIERNNARIFNCSYLPIDDYRAFSETMFLLLAGSGVGYSVQYQHIEKLPDIKKPLKEKKYLIGDNIESWSDAIKVLIKSYFGLTDYKPRFDFSDIREKGTLLVTSGGKAPGPQPLKECLLKIEGILSEKNNGEKLTSLECHDILCHIANCVLAGGIRRAAMIAFFSFDDELMLKCKYGNWWELNEQRGRANNSVVILRNRIKKNDFVELWTRIKDSNSGEPGIFFTNNSNICGNPCQEISLKPFSFCVAGNTKLITKDGIDEIKNLVDKKVEIWNGEEWSKVSPYKTGDSDRLHRVYFNDGSFLDATDNHKFLIKNRFENKFKEVETIELINLLKTSKYKLQIPRSNFKYEGGVDEDSAYNYGFILGDGTISKNSKKPIANLYNDDKKIDFKDVRYVGDYYNHNNKPYTTISFSKVDLDFSRKLKYLEGLPSEIFTWNRNSIIEFISGWADADGCQASKGIRIYGSEDKIRDGQLLLSKIGINSSVNLMSKKGEQTNLCVRKNDVWYLQITTTFGLNTRRLKSDNVDGAKYKGQYQIIRKIETLEGVYDSFCLTEDKLHQCVFNNVLTKQCNLTEINASTLESQEDLNERAHIASFFGTLQAGFTDFHYLRQCWKKATEKDALIGVGMTGIASGYILDLDMSIATNIIKKTNEDIASIISINKAARTTCVKPAGSTSLVLGTSSGIHAWHSNYYIRRMRLNKIEPLYKYLSKNIPELIEDDKLQYNTAIVFVPQASPKRAITREESAFDLLNRVRKFNLEWVRGGHRRGDNYNNVSATVSIKDDEWDEIGSWMWENKESYQGLSVLPFNSGSYIQAPFEDITEDKYNDLLKHLKDIDLTQVIEDQDDTNHSQESACSGNQCELVY